MVLKKALKSLFGFKAFLSWNSEYRIVMLAKLKLFFWIDLTDKREFNYIFIALVAIDELIYLSNAVPPISS